MSHSDVPAPDDSQEPARLSINSSTLSRSASLGHESVRSGNMSLYDRSQHASLSSASTQSPPENEVSSEGHGTPNNDVESAVSRVSSSGEVYSIFTRPQRIMVVVIATTAGFISPLSANTYFPAITSIASSLGVTIGQVELTLTTYMIFQGIAPMFIGGLADSMGRRPAYIIAFTIYLGANIGLALQNNYVALLVLRCLQSTGSSGTVALTYAAVADVSASSERGTYMGWASSGLMLGPAVGPIIGGILSEYLGWHSIFWFLTIASFIMLAVVVIVLPETGRNVVGNGSIPPPAWGVSVITYLQQRRLRKRDARQWEVAKEEARKRKKELAIQRKIRFPNPWRTITIVLEKDVGLLLFTNSFICVSFFCVVATLPQLMEEIYGFNDLQIGLSFIPFGLGTALSAILMGHLMDWNYRRVAKQHGLDAGKSRGNDLRGFPIEKARVQCAVPLLYIGLCLYILYGWLFELEVHYTGPLVVLFFQGFCINGAFTVLSTFLVDLYPQSPATATSANNLVRCLIGAGATGLIAEMLDAMGRGWCFTFVALVVGAWSPGLWLIMKYGPRWREARYVRLQKAEEEKQARHQRDNSHDGTLHSTSDHEIDARRTDDEKKAHEHHDSMEGTATGSEETEVMAGGVDKEHH